MKKLKRLEFKRALEKGFGRAILHVKEHGAKGLEGLILEACIHDWAYDTQLEGDRGDYLWMLLQALPDWKQFEQPILTAFLAEEPHSWALAQMAQLALRMAKNGSVAARESLYARFKPYQVYWMVEHPILELDGNKGLFFIANGYGRYLETHPEAYVEEGFIWDAQKFGTPNPLEALQNAAQADHHIARLLRLLEDKRRQQPDPDEPKKIPSLDEVIKQIEAHKGRYGGRLGLLGGRLKRSDQKRLFELAMQEKRPQKLASYLHAIKRIKPPLPHQRLFELAQSPKTNVQSLAFEILGTIRSKTVRELALDLLGKQPNSFKYGVLELLRKNYRKGDHKFIAAALEAASVMSTDEAHVYVMDLKALAREHLDPAFTPFLRWAYRNSPCTYCREGILDLLIELKRATLEQLEECQYDCQEETRALARNALESALKV